MHTIACLVKCALSVLLPFCKLKTFLTECCSEHVHEHIEPKFLGDGEEKRSEGVAEKEGFPIRRGCCGMGRGGG